MSDRTLTVCSNASAPGSEFGLSDRQLLELFIQQENQEESGLSDDQLQELLEQLEQRKQAIACKIARTEATSTDLHWTPSGQLGFDEAKADTSTPEKRCTGSSTAESLSASNPTPESVSPGRVKLSSMLSIGNARTEDSACAVCGVELGKRKLRPRHHCRICGGSVCNNCSPSSVRLEGEKVLQRVCNPCVLNVQVAPVLRGRLDLLRVQLDVIGSSVSSMQGTGDSLEDAVHRCESTLPGLERESDNHRRTKADLEEVRTSRAVAETRATEAEIQGKRLSEDNTYLASQLESSEQSAKEASTRTAEDKQQARAEQDRLEGVAAEFRFKLQHAENKSHDALQQLSWHEQRTKAEHDRLEVIASGIHSELEHAEKEAYHALQRLCQQEEQAQAEQDRLKVVAVDVSSELQHAEKEAHHALQESAQIRQQAQVEQNRMEGVIAQLRSDLEQGEMEAHDALMQVIEKQQEAETERDRSEELRTGLRSELAHAENDINGVSTIAAEEKEEAQSGEARLKDVVVGLRAELEHAESYGNRMSLQTAQDQVQSTAEQGRLEEVVAGLHTEIAHANSRADAQNAATKQDFEEKLRIAEARVDKFEAKEASERLHRQGLASELRELREAHCRAAPGSDIPLSSPEQRDLSADVAASILQVMKAELQEAKHQSEQFEGELACERRQNANRCEEAQHEGSVECRDGLLFTPTGSHSGPAKSDTAQDIDGQHRYASQTPADESTAHSSLVSFNADAGTTRGQRDTCVGRGNCAAM